MTTPSSLASDRAARYRCVLIDATAVLGADAAETYLRTGNFALGGTAPAELLESSEGERVVLNDLRAPPGVGSPVTCVCQPVHHQLGLACCSDGRRRSYSLAA